MFEVDNPHGVLVASDALATFAVGLNEAQPLLTVVFLGDKPLTLQRAAQHDPAALVLPTGQCQCAIDPFPALAGIAPTRPPEQTLNGALDVLRQAQFEQVELRPRFEFAQDAVRPKPQSLRTLFGLRCAGSPSRSLGQPGSVWLLECSLPALTSTSITRRRPAIR